MAPSPFLLIIARLLALRHFFLARDRWSTDSASSIKLQSVSTTASDGSFGATTKPSGKLAWVSLILPRMSCFAGYQEDSGSLDRSFPISASRTSYQPLSRTGHVGFSGKE